MPQPPWGRPHENLLPVGMGSYPMPWTAGTDNERETWPNEATGTSMPSHGAAFPLLPHSHNIQGDPGYWSRWQFTAVGSTGTTAAMSSVPAPNSTVSPPRDPSGSIPYYRPILPRQTNFSQPQPSNGRTSDAPSVANVGGEYDGGPQAMEIGHASSEDRYQVQNNLGPAIVEAVAGMQQPMNPNLAPTPASTQGYSQQYSETPTEQPQRQPRLIPCLRCRLEKDKVRTS